MTPPLTFCYTIPGDQVFGIGLLCGALIAGVFALAGLWWARR